MAISRDACAEEDATSRDTRSGSTHTAGHMGDVQAVSSHVCTPLAALETSDPLAALERALEAGNLTAESVFGAILRDIDKSDEGLAAAFKKVDTSGDGKISSEEMRAYITKVYGKGLDEKTFAAMMKVADVNGDGEIDLDEFKTIMRAGPGVSHLTAGVETKAEPEAKDDGSDDESEVSSEESAFDLVQEAQATAERSAILARVRGLPRRCSFSVMDYAPATQQTPSTRWGAALAAVEVAKKEVDTSQCHEHMQLEQRRRQSVLLLRALEHIKPPVQEPSPPSVIPVVKKLVDPERVRRKEVEKEMEERRRKLKDQKEAILRLGKDMQCMSVC